MDRQPVCCIILAVTQNDTLITVFNCNVGRVISISGLTSYLVQHGIVECDVIITFRCVRRDRYIKGGVCKCIGCTIQPCSSSITAVCIVVDVVYIRQSLTSRCCNIIEYYILCILIRSTCDLVCCCPLQNSAAGVSIIVYSRSYASAVFHIEIAAAVTVRIQYAAVYVLSQFVLHHLCTVSLVDGQLSRMISGQAVCVVLCTDHSAVGKCNIVRCSHRLSLVHDVGETDVLVNRITVCIDRLPGHIYVVNVVIFRELLVTQNVTTNCNGVGSARQIVLSYCNFALSLVLIC